MLFTLEILQAKHGDCLLLHYGSTTEPKLLLIDGGPSGVYANFLKPRLLEIKQAISERDSLKLEMVMVSHADDDHINGIKMLTNELVSNKEDQVAEEDRLFKIGKLWFNAFDDIIGNIEIPTIAALSGDATLASAEIASNEWLSGADAHIAAVIASTGQGRTIRKNAEALGLQLNAGFSPLSGDSAALVRGDQGEPAYQADGLNITVIHPNAQRLQELQQQWDEDLQRYKDAGDESIILASFTHMDTSPFNLSSIVCVAEFGDKRILLTGDARSDAILSGLRENGFLDDQGKVHFDVLKMPHHGSDANMKPDFLDAVSADHYVFSADGKHHNPDQDTLTMMTDHVGEGIIHFTNYEGEFGLKNKMDDFKAGFEQSGKPVYISYPEQGHNSSLINLYDPLNY